MEFLEKVLVLQVGRFKESDLWVRFLSPTRGVLSAFAFGGCRSRRRFVGCLDVFNEINVRVTPSGRGAYLALQEGMLIKGLLRLRTDWLRFGIATNCAKFLQSFGVGAEGAEKAHFLFTRTLRLLEEADRLPELLPLLFRARLVFDQGYAMGMHACAACSLRLDDMEERGVYFFVREGQMLCASCAAKQPGQAVFLGAESLAAFTAIQTGDPVSWGALCLSSTAKKQCAKVIDSFIQFHVGLAWENGRFARV